MSNIRSTNELILSSLDYFRVAQPALDTKPGTVARDLVIDGPSAQISRVYDELNRVSTLQSWRFALGADLDKLGANVGAVKETGSKSTGPALLTFSSLDADIAISRGDLVTAKNGATFQVQNSIIVSSVFSSSYKATAAKFRADLDFIGNTDQFAVECLVQATATGISGRISQYSLFKTNIVGVNSVTNVFPFGGGNDTESDASFKARILGIFAGANTGTANGYQIAAKGDPAVSDAIVIGPGDTLMTRDGTQVSVAADGTRTIFSEGTGGKVDIIIFGSRLQSAVDSYIYHDLSNTANPTNTANDFVLGQIASDLGKTVTRKRIDDLAAETLPEQPVNNIVQVSGSRSGPNFAEKVVDNLGRVSGNYELIRDVGAFGGSAFGFDRLHWISDRISNYTEDRTKLSFNGQDPVTFADVTEIKSVIQNIAINNENPKVSLTDRTSLQLSHFPISNVTRVFNVTTGERYVVTSQAPDGTPNQTGRILISGKSLPAVSDILQADYTWNYSYDSYFDFDNRVGTNNPRTAQDSIDWGLSNAVRRERATLLASGSFLAVNVSHPVNNVISVNIFNSGIDTIRLNAGRLYVTVGTAISNIVSIVRDSDGAELWTTLKADGVISGFNIYFPTDSVAVIGDSVSITYNALDVYNATTVGNFNGTVITIVPSTDAVAGKIVEATYLADVTTLLPATLLSALPAIRSGNGFKVLGSTLGTQPTTHLFSGNTIVQNLRQAPSNLALTLAGNTTPGVITVTGLTFARIMDVVFTIPIASLKQDLTSAIKSFYKINSQTAISSNLRIIRVVRVEKVTANSSNDVLSSDFTYDLNGYGLFDNSYVKSEAIATAIKVTEFVLPSTPANLAQIPTIGNKFRVRFYVATTGDTENVYFSKAGVLYTNKKFATIDTIGISSGFSGSTANLTVANMNQPSNKSRYKATYDYTGPKSNERISIDFNFQKIIGDVTLNIEASRPITADVLVKSGTPVLVDVTMNIVVTTEFINNTSQVLQNVRDAITAALSPNSLGTIVDSSDLIPATYTIGGVDRARILFFNKTGKTGSVLSITAQKNEYLVANNIIVNLETR